MKANILLVGKNLHNVQPLIWLLQMFHVNRHTGDIGHSSVEKNLQHKSMSGVLKQLTKYLVYMFNRNAIVPNVNKSCCI